jgi:hypothetical protein
VLDSLFDGPGHPPYVGASRRIEDVFYEQPAFGAVRVFSRWFWGNDGMGVLAVLCVKADRPVVMSVIAIGSSETADLEDGEAERLALKSAKSRLRGL